MNNIAIRGHLFRGKKVIQILESLGGKNNAYLNGKSDNYYYINKNDNKIECHNYRYVNEHCKKYTLEEFEIEFPFKIGDKVTYDYTPNLIGTVIDIKFDDNIPYRVDFKGTMCTCGTMMLKLYKEMEEKRNITITLEKAKEWYNEGGELRQIALQAFSEEELSKVELPKTWEEFCNSYPMKGKLSYIDNDSNIRIISCYDNDNFRDKNEDKNLCSSENSAKAHLALIQLEQLRDCYRQGDIPDFTKGINKYCIAKINKRIDVIESCYTSYFLSFTKKEIAEEFLTNFEPLIKVAEDYI